ncbi:MAG: tetratricopeptide repeat protein [Saprospiraceae bacterium]|nr:tetratricopeptide repeat protein [Saprospiraceae bacterium]
MDKKILLLFCLLFVAGISYSNAQKLLKKADLHIQNHEYDKAAQQYLQYLKKNKNDYEAMNLLAASLAKSGDLSNADIWYNKIITENQAVQHEIILQHGLVLKKMGYYKDALSRFNELKKFNYAEGTFYTQGCDFALNEVSKKADYELTSLPVNSSASDY